MIFRDANFRRRGISLKSPEVPLIPHIRNGQSEPFVPSVEEGFQVLNSRLGAHEGSNRFAENGYSLTSALVYKSSLSRTDDQFL